MHYKTKEVLDTLQWDKAELLKRMQLQQLRRIEEQAKTVSLKPSIQTQYIADNKKSLVTRMTLYNILNGKHKASEKIALLMKTVINDALKSRNLKQVSYDDIGIEVFKR